MNEAHESTARLPEHTARMDGAKLAPEASGGTPCVAAHSTTRALYSAYDGRLYQVERASDGGTREPPVLSTGGYADAAAQDSFCAATSCLFTVVYDQPGQGNHLTQAPPGGFSVLPRAATTTSRKHSPRRPPWAATRHTPRRVGSRPAGCARLTGTA